MHPIRDYGWLLTGVVAAVCVSWLGVGSAVRRALESVAPVPWGGIGTGLLVFAAFAALHFRLQLLRALDAQRNHWERSAAASRLILTASGDGRRWLRVVQENLELVADGSQADRERRLYLEGAQANADKLEQAFDRIEGNQQRLDDLDEVSGADAR